MENSSHITLAKTASLFDKLDDYTIAKIILALPKDIPQLYLVSDRLRNVIDTDHICKKVHKFGLTPSLYTAAINDNDFECVQYAFENGCKFTMYDHDVANGIVQPGINIFGTDHNFSNHASDLCLMALEKNNMQCVRYLHDKGHALSELFGSYASRTGNLVALKYYKESGGTLTVEMCTAAATDGRIDCLKYLLENNCPKECITSACCASGGHLDCLKCLLDNKCETDEYVCANSIRGNHFEFFKYAIENGCPFHYDHIFSMSLRRPEIRDYIVKNETKLREMEFALKKKMPAAP